MHEPGRTLQLIHALAGLFQNALLSFLVFSNKFLIVMVIFPSHVACERFIKRISSAPHGHDYMAFKPIRADMSH